MLTNHKHLVLYPILMHIVMHIQYHKMVLIPILIFKKIALLLSFSLLSCSFVFNSIPSFVLYTNTTSNELYIVNVIMVISAVVLTIDLLSLMIR